VRVVGNGSRVALGGCSIVVGKGKLIEYGKSSGDRVVALG